MSQHIEGILSTVETEAACVDIPDGMCGDQWVLSSAMQKAIRRGETERAMKAGRGLWQQDRRSFWRRLHITALEDVGIGDINAVTTALTVYASPSFRQRTGDLQTGLCLIRILCAAVKSRLADEMFIGIEKLSDYAGLRVELAGQDDTALADNVLDDARPLHERCLALRLLAGTKRFPSDLMLQRKGSPEMVMDVLHDLDTDPGLTASCAAVMYRTQWPLALLMPLLAKSLPSMPQPSYIWYDAIPAASDVEGVPVYAADMFTRIGKTCIRHFQKAVPELKTFNTQQIGLAVFYEDGGQVDKALTGPVLEHYKQMGEIADFQFTGLCIPEMLGIRECVRRYASLLEQIRQDQLRQYFNGSQLELQWTGA